MKLSLCAPSATIFTIGFIFAIVGITTGSIQLVTQRLTQAFIYAVFVQLLCMLGFDGLAWAVVIIYVMLSMVATALIIMGLMAEKEKKEEPQPVVVLERSIPD